MLEKTDIVEYPVVRVAIGKVTEGGIVYIYKPGISEVTGHEGSLKGVGYDYENEHLYLDIETSEGPLYVIAKVPGNEYEELKYLWKTLWRIYDIILVDFDAKKGTIKLKGTFKDDIRIFFESYES